MSLAIKCQACGREVFAEQELAIGQHVRCPYCHQKFAYMPQEEFTSVKQVARKRTIVKPTVRQHSIDIVRLGLAIVIISVLGGAAWFGWKSKAEYDQELAHRRMQAEEDFKNAEAEERQLVIAEGEAIAKAKAEAVAGFRAYLERETEQLKKTIDESTVAANEIFADQKKLAEILKAINEENERREARAKTNGWIRYEKPETVMMVLKDAEMNALAEKYLGEDFSSLQKECRESIKSAMQLHAETVRMLAANRERYQQEVKDLDSEVDQKLIRAQEQSRSSNKIILKRQTELERNLTDRKTRLKEMQKSRASWTNALYREAEMLQSESMRLSGNCQKCVKSQRSAAQISPMLR